MTKTNVFSLQAASEKARKLVHYFQPACHRIEIAGSIRRQVAQVHDIDLVLWPIYESWLQKDIFGVVIDREDIPRALIDLVSLYMTMKADAKMVHFVTWEMPVELYLAEPDGSNFEALLQMRTGSAEYNRNLAWTAQRKQLYYRAGYGIYRMAETGRYETRVDDGTEPGIFTALGIPYVAPEKMM